jgi:L-aminopeptidase/D-esterase-like protein
MRHLTQLSEFGTRPVCTFVGCLLICLVVAAYGNSQEKPRARDLGIPFVGTPGPLNAITDVQGVEVGFVTLISGEGKLKRGSGPVRTGVTAILPRGKTSDPVFAGWYTLNGAGEMTGTTWIEESGFLEGPVMITNSHSVGDVHAGVIRWLVKNDLMYKTFSNPVVAETNDGRLSDINGFHVTEEHTIAALNSATSGPVAEGNVGGGTGMWAHGFKGGTGTSSRRLTARSGEYTVGVLVQANYGSRWNFTVAGVPVGREITDLRGIWNPERPSDGDGSIIVVVATDAPLLSHQLKRLARRVPLGIAKVGGRGGNGSGDIFVAFSTANPGAGGHSGIKDIKMLPNTLITPFFEATVNATEEAIINAMIAAETMVGANGNTAFALPHDRLRQVLKKYNRLVDTRLFDPAYLEQFVGTYVTVARAKIRVELSRGVLTSTGPGGRTSILEPEISGRFVLKNYRVISYEFVFDTEGEVCMVRIHSPARIREAERLKE